MKGPGKAQLITAVVALAVAYMLSEPHPVIAQRVGAAPGPKTNPPSARGADGRDGGTGFDKRDTSADLQTAMLRRQAAAELAEDFERLMRINRERILPLSATSSLDYKELSQVSSEIKRRAKRIKSNSPLALKEKKKGEKWAYQADPAHLISMLPELSRLIDSFLGDARSYTVSVRDDEPRSTAGRDLESIIRLSDTINKIAKRLARTSNQPT